MDYIHSMVEGTLQLHMAVGVLQGTRWDITQEEARQYLRDMDMDLSFASGLVADMAADNFNHTMTSLSNSGYGTTGYKSIAVWVRKFGYEAHLSHGDRWEITPCPEVIHEAVHGHGWGNMGYWRSHKLGCAGILALIIAILAFLGIWMFTGSIWAAIYFFEVIFEVLMEIVSMFE
ncbi:MAG: hypothetical protein FWE11_04635 [Defluviitaleaceae bacterium]|nr:hypothetical protein [Defluviitaleaceae bacterium]